MLALILCASLLAIATDVVDGKYVYRPKIHGWIAQHKVIGTWEEAYKQCREEDFAMLASPFTDELRDEMVSMMSGDTLYFIGTRAHYHTGPYVSLEGILLDEMPIDKMMDYLDPRQGQCLAASKVAVRPVPCTNRLPFMCYKKQEEESRTLECGTTDPGYVFDYSTHSCLKLHKVKKSWPQAYASCITEGGRLAVFNDENSAQAVKNITFPADVSELFVGLQDRAGNGDWLNIYGQRAEETYNVWNSGEKPSNPLLRCAGVLKSGKLDAFSCDAEKHFLCEKLPINTRFPAENDESQQ